MSGLVEKIIEDKKNIEKKLDPESVETNVARISNERLPKQERPRWASTLIEARKLRWWWW